VKQLQSKVGQVGYLATSLSCFSQMCRYGHVLEHCG
jgi:hypothetical protein